MSADTMIDVATARLAPTVKCAGIANDQLASSAAGQNIPPTDRLAGKSHEQSNIVSSTSLVDSGIIGTVATADQHTTAAPKIIEFLDKLTTCLPIGVASMQANVLVESNLNSMLNSAIYPVCVSQVNLFSALS